MENQFQLFFALTIVLVEENLEIMQRLQKLLKRDTHLKTSYNYNLDLINLRKRSLFTSK